jgi:hypothetical protein
MRTIGLIPTALAGLIPIAFGVRYLVTKEFMPYHETVSGKTWVSIEPRLQAIILGMLKVAGAGFLGYGIAILWLLLPISQGSWWAPPAVITISIALSAPILYVTLWLRRIEPSAKTPTVPTAIVLSLAVIGAILGWVS